MTPKVICIYMTYFLILDFPSFLYEYPHNYKVTFTILQLKVICQFFDLYINIWSPVDEFLVCFYIPILCHLKKFYKFIGFSFVVSSFISYLCSARTGDEGSVKFFD